ncbi:MAG: NAD(P)-dependent oxidoreductase [Planctomycetota bacterium]
MKVLVADKIEKEALDGLKEIGCEVSSQPDLDPDTIGAAVAELKPAVVVVRSTKFREPAIKQAEDSIKLVVRAGSGYDNIDHAYAATKGIGVSNCPGMNAVAVAEVTIGHLISLDRRLVDQTIDLRGGRWDKKGFGVAKGLKGRKLLIIGTGAIGLEVIKRAQAFGMQITAQSRNLTEAQATAMGCNWIPFTREAIEQTLPHMDAVSVHVAATPETKGLCGPGFFAAMADGAYFVNTSRGEIVDEAALVAAVESGKIRAAVDVYQDQPSFKEGEWNTPLAGPAGIYNSHHCGASTDQAQLAVAEEVVAIVKQFKDEGSFKHCVNGV